MGDYDNVAGKPTTKKLQLLVEAVEALDYMKLNNCMREIDEETRKQFMLHIVNSAGVYFGVDAALKQLRNVVDPHTAVHTAAVHLMIENTP